jgi:hypothetical protein
MPRFSKLITSGWYVFLDSDEGRAEGPAWRIMIGWEGEAAASTLVVRVIREGKRVDKRLPRSASKKAHTPNSDVIVPMMINSIGQTCGAPENLR